MDRYAPLSSLGGASSHASGSRPHYVAKARISSGGQARSSATNAASSPAVKERQRGPRRSAFDTFDESQFCNDLISRISSELAARPKRQYVSRSQSIDPWRGNVELPEKIDAEISTLSAREVDHEESGVQTEEAERVALADEDFKEPERDIDAERTEKTKAAAEAFLQRLQQRESRQDDEEGLEDDERDLERQVFAVFGDQINRQVQLPHEIQSNGSADEVGDADEVESSQRGLIDTILNRERDLNQSKPLIEEVAPQSSTELDREGEYDEIFTSTSDYPQGDYLNEDSEEDDELEESSERSNGVEDEHESFYHHQQPALASRGASEEQAISLIDSDDEDDDVTSSSEDGDATRESEQWYRRSDNVDGDDQYEEGSALEDQNGQDDHDIEEQHLFGFNEEIDEPQLTASTYAPYLRTNGTSDVEGNDLVRDANDDAVHLDGAVVIDDAGEGVQGGSLQLSPPEESQPEGSWQALLPQLADIIHQTSGEDDEPEQSQNSGEIPEQDADMEVQAIEADVLALKEGEDGTETSAQISGGDIADVHQEDNVQKEAEIDVEGKVPHVADQDQAMAEADGDQVGAEEGRKDVDEPKTASTPEPNTGGDAADDRDTKSSPRRSRRHARRSDPDGDLADYVPPEEERKISARRRSRTRTPSVSKASNEHLLVSPGYINPDSSILEEDEAVEEEKGEQEVSSEITKVPEVREQESNEAEDVAPLQDKPDDVETEAVPEDVTAAAEQAGKEAPTNDTEVPAKRRTRNSVKDAVATSSPQSSPRRRRKGDREVASDQPSPKRPRRSARRKVNLNSAT